MRARRIGRTSLSRAFWRFLKFKLTQVNKHFQGVSDGGGRNRYGTSTSRNYVNDGRKRSQTNYDTLSCPYHLTLPFLMVVHSFLRLISVVAANMKAADSLSMSHQVASSASQPMPPMRFFYPRPHLIGDVQNAFISSGPSSLSIGDAAWRSQELSCPYGTTHTTHAEPAYFGLATLVVALNAMAGDPRHNGKNPWRMVYGRIATLLF